MTVERNHFQKGYRLQEDAEWVAASKEFLQVEPNDPDYVLSRCGLAYCLLSSGDYLATIRACKDLIGNRSPDALQAELWLQYVDENPYVLAACALVKLGDCQAAGVMLDAFAQSPPELLQKFFKRSDSSKLWKEIYNSKTQSALITAWRAHI